MGFNKAFEDRKFMIFYVRKLSNLLNITTTFITLNENINQKSINSQINLKNIINKEDHLIEIIIYIEDRMYKRNHQCL